MTTLTNTPTFLQKENLEEFEFIKTSSFDELVKRYHIDFSMYPNEEYAKFEFAVSQEMMKNLDYVDMDNFLVSYFIDKLDDDMEVEDFAVEYDRKIAEYLTEKVFPITEENIRKARTDLSKEYLDENLPKIFKEILKNSVDYDSLLLD